MEELCWKVQVTKKHVKCQAATSLQETMGDLERNKCPHDACWWQREEPTGWVLPMMPLMVSTCKKKWNSQAMINLAPMFLIYPFVEFFTPLEDKPPNQWARLSSFNVSYICMGLRLTTWGWFISGLNHGGNWALLTRVRETFVLRSQPSKDLQKQTDPTYVKRIKLNTRETNFCKEQTWWVWHWRSLKVHGAQSEKSAVHFVSGTLTWSSNMNWKKSQGFTPRRTGYQCLMKELTFFEVWGTWCFLQL